MDKKQQSREVTLSNGQTGKKPIIQGGGSSKIIQMPSRQPAPTADAQKTVSATPTLGGRPPISQLKPTVAANGKPMVGPPASQQAKRPAQTGGPKSAGQIMREQQEAKLATQAERKVNTKALIQAIGGEAAANSSLWDKVLHKDRIAGTIVEQIAVGPESPVECFFNIKDPITGRAPSFVTPPLRVVGAHFEGLGQLPKLSKDDTPFAMKFGCFCSFTLPDSFVDKNPSLRERIPACKAGIKLQCESVIAQFFDLGVKRSAKQNATTLGKYKATANFTEEQKAHYAHYLKHNALMIPEVREAAIRKYIRTANIPSNERKKKSTEGEGEESYTEDDDDTDEGDAGKFDGIFIQMPVFQLTKGHTKKEATDKYLEIIKNYGANPSDRQKLEAMEKTGCVKYNSILVYPPGSSTTLTATEDSIARNRFLERRKMLRDPAAIDALTAEFEAEIKDIFDPFRRRIENGALCSFKVELEGYAQAGEKGNFGLRYVMRESVTQYKAGDGNFRGPLELEGEYMDCDTVDDMIGNTNAEKGSDVVALEIEAIKENDLKLAGSVGVAVKQRSAHMNPPQEDQTTSSPPEEDSSGVGLDEDQQAAVDAVNASFAENDQLVTQAQDEDTQGGAEAEPEVIDNPPPKKPVVALKKTADKLLGPGKTGNTIKLVKETGKPNNIPENFRKRTLEAPVKAPQANQGPTKRAKVGARNDPPPPPVEEEPMEEEVIQEVDQGQQEEGQQEEGEQDQQVEVESQQIEDGTEVEYETQQQVEQEEEVVFDEPIEEPKPTPKRIRRVVQQVETADEE